jgi:hypothetical protein
MCVLGELAADVRHRGGVVNVQRRRRGVDDIARGVLEADVVAVRPVR